MELELKELQRQRDAFYQYDTDVYDNQYFMFGKDYIK